MRVAQKESTANWEHSACWVKVSNRSRWLPGRSEH